MTPERFEVLAEAYGGDVARWPAAEREAAAAVMAAEAAWAADVLAKAGVLDATLSTWAPPRVSAALTDAIVASGPAARSGRRWAAWLVPAGMGAGLAAACAAGLVVGAQFPVAQPTADADPVVTAFSDDDFSLYLDEEAA